MIEPPVCQTTQRIGCRENGDSCSSLTLVGRVASHEEIDHWSTDPLDSEHKDEGGDEEDQSEYGHPLLHGCVVCAHGGVVCAQELSIGVAKCNCVDGLVNFTV